MIRRILLSIKKCLKTNGFSCVIAEKRKKNREEVLL